MGVVFLLQKKPKHGFNSYLGSGIISLYQLLYFPF